VAGWPAAADLAAYLGLEPGDDDERVAAANEAAIADAIHVAGLDPDPATDTLDAGQLEAVLKLGGWWYGGRNRPEGLDSLNPGAAPYDRRVTLGILMRGKLPIA
jgi:hypothetical protein